MIKYKSFENKKALKYLAENYDLDNYVKKIIEIWSLKSEIILYEIIEDDLVIGFMLVSKLNFSSDWYMDYIYLTESRRGCGLIEGFLDNCLKGKKCLIYANTIFSKTLNKLKNARLEADGPLKRYSYITF